MTQRTNITDDRRTADNSTFSIGRVSCSADSLEVAESFVLRINISGKNPAHRKSAYHYASCLGGRQQSTHLDNEK